MIYFRLTYLYYLLFLNVFLTIGSLSACAPAPLLNSERIAQRYGNYGIEIMHAGDGRRISNLYSEEDGRRTMRTLALVEFTAADAAEIATEHQHILAGGSIGAVFKEAGWTIEKVSSHYCLSRVDLASMPELKRMDIDFPATLATYTYVFQVKKAASSINYATITEIYHPDYLQADPLANGYLDDC